MKTIQTFIYSSIFLVILSCNSTGEKNNTETNFTVGTHSAIQKKYQIKSGIITFENDMMGISQKFVLYFEDYGIRETEEKYDGDNIKEATVCDGKSRYTIIYAQKTAYTMGSCYRGVAYKFDWNEISKADKENKVRKEANRIVAGKNCEAYSLESGDYPSTFAGWNNICLFMETRSKFGTVVMKAIRIDENARVPDDKFQVPQGFEIKKGM